jgi:hypothetical protein
MAMLLVVLVRVYPPPSSIASLILCHEAYVLSRLDWVLFYIAIIWHSVVFSTCQYCLLLTLLDANQA